MKAMHCRVCGCTDREPCENGCAWVQAGLCTACLPIVAETPCPEASCGSTAKWCKRPSGHSGPFVAFHRRRIDNARRRRRKLDREKAAHIRLVSIEVEGPAAARIAADALRAATGDDL